jgi:hypothetical protein
MKKIKHITYALSLLLLLNSCEQETIDLKEGPCTDPAVCPPPPCEGATAGSADFTKLVVLGNSFTAGFQAGALFNEGQANSLGAILATQFQCVGAGAFNQPDINSVNGFNLQQSIPGVITLGRLVLFDPDGPAAPRSAAPYPAAFPGSMVTCPSEVTTPALPAPYNTADLPAPFMGNKAALNNFSVPLIYLGQALIKETGGPSTGNPYFNPLYARFASNPGTSTLIGDALGAAGSFYVINLGFDDVLLYAATGADGTYPMTTPEAFQGQFQTAISTMLAVNPLFKGAVGNLPYIYDLPHFFTIKWNQIVLSADQSIALNATLATNYNAFLNVAVTNGLITEEEATERTLTFAAGNNGILMTDKGLTDLSPYMTGPAAALLPYAQARQATNLDLVPLGAGSILGTCYMNEPTALFGVSIPVADRYILTPDEYADIVERTVAFNDAIEAAVAGSGDRLALADVNDAFTTLVTAQGAIQDGVTITPTFAPPTGIFSEDGIHPNSRGYAFVANVFIDAINEKFGATIPKATLSQFKGTGLPVNP